MSPRAGVFPIRRIMSRDYLKTIVACYAGYRGEEEPRRFRWDHRPIDVVEILDRWLDPDHRYFKVRGRDGGVYTLRHDTNTGDWVLRVEVSGSGYKPATAGDD